MVRVVVLAGGALVALLLTQQLTRAAVPKASARAMKCFEAGTIYGKHYDLLDAAGKARGEVLRNYCANVADNTLRRVPTDADVDMIMRELQGVRRSAESDARLNTSPLRDQMKDGQKAEGDMLNELLK